MSSAIPHWFAGEGVTWWSSSAILSQTLTGDETPWTDELSKLWGEDRERMLSLLNDINTRGIKFPVQVAIEGHKRRVIDGHHRIAACTALQIAVPVEFVLWSNDPAVAVLSKRVASLEAEAPNPSGQE